MTPMPENPTIVILVDTSTHQILKVASNIDPELDVTIITNIERFNQESMGKPFKQEFSEKYIEHLYFHQTVRKSIYPNRVEYKNSC